MTVLNGKLYFTASTAAKGYELYSHDGTLFTRITDLAPGSGSGVNSAPVVYNNMIYFAGDTIVGRSQLYSHDPATTALFKWGIGNRNMVSLGSFAIHQNNLFFAVADTALAISFWAHDGFNTGRVFEIDTAKPGGFPSGFDVFNNALFIRGQSAAAGRELFVYGSPVAVHNTSLLKMLEVIPNPTTGYARLQLGLSQTQLVGVTITDATGKSVWESTPTTYSAGQNNVTLPLSNMPAGIYFYYVTGKAGLRLGAGRVIKE
jgi:ELWxxDGT repeat protein